jgi:hypothetical protein
MDFASELPGRVGKKALWRAAARVWESGFRFSSPSRAEASAYNPGAAGVLRYDPLGNERLSDARPPRKGKCEMAAFRDNRLSVESPYSGEHSA